VVLLDVIGWIDGHIAQALNAWSARPGTFNHLLMLVSDNNFLKMAPFVFMVGWYWNRAPLDATRRTVVAGLTGVFVAFFIGRALQISLPMRLRPIHQPGLGLTLPEGYSPDMLGGWSSLPSDHAAIFIALAGLAFALSRRWGWATLAYAVVLVVLPRVYFGVHFLSDVLAGMAVGAVAALIALRTPVARVVEAPLLWLEARQPALFYAVALLFIAQLIEMFGDVRKYAAVMKGMLVGTL
jgi:undecaprenyl-diphosphatase